MSHSNYAKNFTSLRSCCDRSYWIGRSLVVDRNTTYKASLVVMYVCSY